jgi:hypothetical protein
MRASILAVGIGICFAAGCTSVGTCDQPRALSIVYDEDGIPAYEGQALVIQSCGGGGYCHSEGITAVDRHGAPAGLDFDLRIASTSTEANELDVARLGRGQINISHVRSWAQVSAGRMPPGGEAAMLMMMTHPPVYERKTGATTYEPIASLATPEGRETFRNWLACGAPVIERTVEATTAMANPIGFTVPEADPPRRCSDITWPSLYATVIEPRCAFGGCHGPTSPVAGFSLAATGVDLAAINALGRGLVGTTVGSDSPICGAEAPTTPYVTAGDPASSLLYLKVQADNAMRPCGARMPLLGAFLPEQRLCALQAWIRCGACTDRACRTANATCISTARTMCAVDNNCLVPGRCELDSDCREREMCVDELCVAPPP